MSPGLAKRIQPSSELPKSTQASLKIQNALERNMQRLNLNSKSQQSITPTKNLTEEDMELFTGKQKSNGYFSGDSLSSTPEHRLQKQTPAPSVVVQEFILNHVKPKMTVCDREMTPDSINNDPIGDEQPEVCRIKEVVMPCVEEGLSDDNYEDDNKNVNGQKNCKNLIEYEGQVYYGEEDDDDYVDDDGDDEDGENDKSMEILLKKMKKLLKVIKRLVIALLVKSRVQLKSLRFN